MTPKELTIPLVTQYYFEVRRETKMEVTARLLDYYAPARSLIFCNTKKMVDELAKYLKGKGYPVEGLHGDLSQMQRDRVMHGFRTGGVNILIATDVAARGIDVDDVEAVLNYDVPQDIEYYVHRIGRTGRAGRKGKSFTLVAGRDRYRIREIEQFCHTTIEAKKLPSAKDVVNAKAAKILGEVTVTCREQELDAMKVLIEEWMDREQITALEAAAAFLKTEMGEDIQDIPEVEHYNRRRGKTDTGRRNTNHSAKSSGKRDGRHPAKQGEKREDRMGKRQERPTKRNNRRNDENRAKQSQNVAMPKEKDVRNDGTVAPKRKRHDHTGQRKKLITGENKDYGYDTDASVYRRPSVHAGPLEIKTKEDVTNRVEPQVKRTAGKTQKRKNSFRIFKKK